MKNVFFNILYFHWLAIKQQLTKRKPIYVKTKKPCGVDCWKARSIDCRCSCAGENHGKYWKLRKQGILMIPNKK